MSTSEDLLNVPAGTYQITVTDSSGCELVASYTITQNDPVDANETIENENGATANDGSITVNPTGGTPPFTYLWMPGGETTQTIDNLDAGTYTVVITDANGCTYEKTFTVDSTNALPEAQNDQRNVNENTALNIDVLVNDSYGADGPGNGQLEIASNPPNGLSLIHI